MATGVPGTVHFGRVRIVNFLQEITEMPGYERALSRCRCRGRRFRAGRTVNQSQVYRRLAWGSGMSGGHPVNHLGC